MNNYRCWRPVISVGPHNMFHRLPVVSLPVSMTVMKTAMPRNTIGPNARGLTLAGNCLQTVTLPDSKRNKERGPE